MGRIFSDAAPVNADATQSAGQPAALLFNPERGEGSAFACGYLAVWLVAD